MMHSVNTTHRPGFQMFGTIGPKCKVIHWIPHFETWFVSSRLALFNDIQADTACVL